MAAGARAACPVLVTTAEPDATDASAIQEPSLFSGRLHDEDFVRDPRFCGYVGSYTKRLHPAQTFLDHLYAQAPRLPRIAAWQALVNATADFEVFDGYCLYRRNRRLIRPGVGHGSRVRAPGRAQMTIFYLIGALAAGGLLAYLTYALFNAEEL
jgi:hypothetical protein